MEKMLEIIQNGNVSYVPDHKSTRDFWTRYNVLVSKSRDAEKEMVTFRPVSIPAPALPVSKPVVETPPAKTDEMEDLRRQLAQQSALISTLLAGQEKEKSKPGPKPKNNGETKD